MVQQYPDSIGNDGRAYAVSIAALPVHGDFFSLATWGGAVLVKGFVDRVDHFYLTTEGGGTVLDYIRVVLK